MNNLILSDKQEQFIVYGNRTYNVKTGARGGGKTHIDILFTIANRVRQLKQYKGMFILCGNTLESIDDNILNPMRSYWGVKCVPERKNKTTIKLFGTDFRLIGASKKDRINILKGKNILYAYCDEITTYVDGFFEMLDYGLRCTDSEGNLVSIADFTCNPDNPTHWFKVWFDKQLEKFPESIFYQHYTMYENPFLSKEYILNKEEMYRGTVYFDRWILGLWTFAEGIIFQQFANNPELYLLDTIDYNKIHRVHIGVDFGDVNSKTMFIASAVINDNGVYKIVVLEELHVKHKLNTVDASMVVEKHYEFYNMVIEKYRLSLKQIRNCVSWCDHMGLIINQMRNYHKNKSSDHSLNKVDKNTIGLSEYILTINALFNLNKLYILKHNDYMIKSLQGLLYDDKKEDAVLDDNHTCDVDTYDAFRYSISLFLRKNHEYKFVSS